MKNEIKEITEIITILQDCGRKSISRTEGVIVENKDIATALDKAGYRKVDGNTSDGYHTFNELYHHRAVLFAMICNQNNGIAWKSKKHNDGTMFDGMFIVGIETPQGQATYHYDILPYWDFFKVKELKTAPIWDGHTPSQAIDRILEMSKEATGYRKQSDTVKEFAEKAEQRFREDSKWLDIMLKGYDCKDSEDYDAVANAIIRGRFANRLNDLAAEYGKEE